MPELHTREQIVGEIRRVVGNATAETFNRATEARTNYLFRLLDVMSAQDGAYNLRNRFGRSVDPAAIAEREQRRHEEIRRDPAAFHFFSARSNHQPLVSSAGTRLTEQAFRQNGRAVGNVVQMRTYAALNETTLEEGGQHRTDSLLGRSASPIEADRRNFPGMPMDQHFDRKPTRFAARR